MRKVKSFLVALVLAFALAVAVASGTLPQVEPVGTSNWSGPG